MATIQHRVPVASSAHSAWKKLSSLGDVHHLVSFLSSAAVDGDRRSCRIDRNAPMQGTLEGIILGVDDEIMRVAYSIVDSPFGFEHHAASMQIVPTDGRCEFLWTTDVKPDRVKAEMATVFESEARHIAQQLGF